MRPLVTILAVAVLLGWAGPVLADPLITQTGCDTLSLDPFQVSFGFRVVSVGEGPLTYFQVIPQPQEAPGACVVQSCTAPDRWGGFLHPGYKGAEFHYLQLYVPYGSVEGPFRIVTGATSCPYDVLYFTSGSPEWFREETVTFTSPAPVPTLPTSWGRVKATYR